MSSEATLLLKNTSTNSSASAADILHAYMSHTCVETDRYIKIYSSSWRAQHGCYLASRHSACVLKQAATQLITFSLVRTLSWVGVSAVWKWLHVTKHRCWNTVASVGLNNLSCSSWTAMWQLNTQVLVTYHREHVVHTQPTALSTTGSTLQYNVDQPL